MKRILLILSICLVAQTTRAQELETILLAADDASLLTENYLNPAMKGLMFSMNGGWYTTAKTHKKFGFDITINANASFVPSKEQMFDFVPSDYSFLSLPNGETSLPTLMSEDDRETTIDISIPNGDGTYKVASFDMPGGITEDLPVNAVPTPMVQLGFGLPLKTDLHERVIARPTPLCYSHCFMQHSPIRHGPSLGRQNHHLSSPRHLDSFLRGGLFCLLPFFGP